MKDTWLGSIGSHSFFGSVSGTEALALHVNIPIASMWKATTEVSGTVADMFQLFQSYSKQFNFFLTASEHITSHNKYAYATLMLVNLPMLKGHGTHAKFNILSVSVRLRNLKPQQVMREIY